MCQRNCGTALVGQDKCIEQLFERLKGGWDTPLSVFVWHRRVMANYRPPDLIWLHPQLNRTVDTNSTQLAMDDVTGIGIGIWKEIA